MNLSTFYDFDLLRSNLKAAALPSSAESAAALNLPWSGELSHARYVHVMRVLAAILCVATASFAVFAGLLGASLISFDWEVDWPAALLAILLGAVVTGSALVSLSSAAGSYAKTLGTKGADPTTESARMSATQRARRHLLLSAILCFVVLGGVEGLGFARYVASGSSWGFTSWLGFSAGILVAAIYVTAITWTSFALNYSRAAADSIRGYQRRCHDLLLSERSEKAEHYRYAFSKIADAENLIAMLGTTEREYQDDLRVLIKDLDDARSCIQRVPLTIDHIYEKKIHELNARIQNAKLDHKRYPYTG